MELSRRNFIKLSAAGALAAASASPLEANALPLTTPSDFGVEKKVNMCCRMCAQFCPMVGYVRDGRLIRTEANKNTPYPAVCGRGRSAAAALYNPDRIKTPLIRVGERGSGEFRSASWEEALDTVAANMNNLRSKGLAHTMAYFPRFNTAPVLDDAIIKQYGCYNFFGYGDTCYASANELGLGSVFGGGRVPRPGTSAVMGDYEHAKLAVLISRNPAGGLVAFPWGAMFGRGRRNGLKTVVIDPRKSYGTGETDGDWLPVRPGTDPILLMGLAREIIVNKYYDEDFVRKYTNADMLVNSETLQPVKTENDFEKNADYLVFDSASDSVLMKSQAVQPAITGEFEVNGIKVKTAMQMLADSCEEYTLDRMEKECGVKGAQISELAKKLNEAKPACFLERGYRATRYYNSTKEKQFIAVINALLGVYGREGGLIYGRNVKVKSPFSPAKSAETTVTSYYQKNMKGFELINTSHSRRVFTRASKDGKPYKMTVAFINGQNPVGGGTGGIETAEELKKLEFIAAVSPFWNETVMLADVILPDCTFMERREPVYSSYKAAFPVMAVNDRAVEPMFDSRDGYWIMTQLAKRILTPEEYHSLLGGFETGGMDYIINHQLENISGMTETEKAAFSKDAFLSSGVWTGEPTEVKPKAKNTRTGKLEIYSTFMAEWNDKLKKEGRDSEAAYFSPLFQWAPPYWQTKKAVLSEDEFVPVTGFNPLSSFTGAQTRNNVMLRTVGETMNYDAVFINAGKGRSLGLQSGDTVEIFNIEKPEHTELSKVVLTETVQPDALFSFYGVGTGYFTNIAEKLKTASHIGFNPNHIGNPNFCPVDGTAPSQDFIVKIRRVK